MVYIQESHDVVLGFSNLLLCNSKQCLALSSAGRGDEGHPGYFQGAKRELLWDHHSPIDSPRDPMADFQNRLTDLFQ